MAAQDTSVSFVEIDYNVLLEKHRDRRDEITPVYEFGNGRKQFFDIYQDEGLYGKPTEIVDGQIVHLPDPE